MRRVLLAAYSVRVKKNGREEQLSNFGGGHDFLTFFRDFAEKSITNIRKWEQEKRPTYRLTCPPSFPPKLVEENREVYGFFDAGRDGDRFRIGNFDVEKEPVLTDVRDEDTSLRECFFYLRIPKGASKGHLILQVPEGQGIKFILEHFLREYRDEIGLKIYSIEIASLFNEKIFNRMVEVGKLKEMTFTKYGIPAKLDKLKGKDEKIPLSQGRIKTTYQSNDFGAEYLEIAKGLWGAEKKEGNSKVVVEIMDDTNEYDEVSMMVEVDGKQKTFNVTGRNRTALPDVDVTKMVNKDKTGRLNISELLIQCNELIEDVTFIVKKEDVEV